MEPIIEAINIRNYLGNKWVHDGLNLTIYKGEVLAIVGGSGAGKSTLLREILMLQPPTSGTIKFFGKPVSLNDPKELMSLRKRCGVLFQQGALFSSLTLLQNVIFPLHEHTKLDHNLLSELAILKILAAGLTVNDAVKFPAELSGGMQKRAALARAIALDPELLFLDEPTAGLDPQSAAELDELVINLQKTLGLTIVIVTHDLDTLWRVTNRVAFIGEGKVLAVAPIAELVKDQHPLIQNYFAGPRGRVVERTYGNGIKS